MALSVHEGVKRFRYRECRNVRRRTHLRGERTSCVEHFFGGRIRSFLQVHLRSDKRLRETTMPGYKPLPLSVTGSEADQVRQAESRRRGGDPATAIRLLEDALEASLLLTPVLPGWLCGRLAALYRTIGRHDDEVLLLERFRDSQEVEEARTRYNARPGGHRASRAAPV